MKTATSANPIRFPPKQPMKKKKETAHEEEKKNITFLSFLIFFFFFFFYFFFSFFFFLYDIFKVLKNTGFHFEHFLIPHLHRADSRRLGVG
jgi:hypothetical protein